MGALVIQAFSPSSTYASPSRRAVVAMAAGSEPADDSVRPKHPISLPALAATEPEALLAQFELHMLQPRRQHIGCTSAGTSVCTQRLLYASRAGSVHSCMPSSQALHAWLSPWTSGSCFLHRCMLDLRLRASVSRVCVTCMHQTLNRHIVSQAKRPPQAQHMDDGQVAGVGYAEDSSRCNGAGLGAAAHADAGAPCARSGSQRARCSSLPKAWIACMTSEPCTLQRLRSALSPRSSSCSGAARVTASAGLPVRPHECFLFSSRAQTYTSFAAQNS